MKISYNWLKEYIDLKESPEKTAELLTQSGSEVKVIDKIDGDYLMDIEITPNRSDCLSYIGITREVAVLTGKKTKMPSLEARQKKSGKAPFTVEIKDKDLCPRYTARLIKDVKVGESPAWLKKKVELMGLRPVNNVVDITNFVLFELGQPMHAFDYDKIKGKAIIIRRSQKGESITSIDSVERKLEKDTLVIADKENSIAIGGVMGALNTEVTESTRSILLESAYFNPVSVRRTSLKLGLVSESSYRFERSVDPGMVLPASDRAALLIVEICGGEIAELVDKGEKPKEKTKISLRIDRLNQILGLKLKETYIKNVLSKLCFKTTSGKKGILKVSPPSFRQDIKGEADLIEEISRIYGYENITGTIPQIVPNPERKPTSLKTREKAAEILVSMGLNEIITYGMVGRGVLNKVFGARDDVIAVKNPLSAEQEVMRPSLVPGVLNVLNWNINRRIKDLKVFEIGNIYNKDSGGAYVESTNICIALTGLFKEDWQRAKSNVTFFDLKGIIETLFFELGLEKFTLVKKSELLLTKNTSSEILYGGGCVGKAGSLAINIQNTFDLDQEVYLAEIHFDKILPSINLGKKFRDIPKYPSVKRDISLIVKDDLSFEKIVSLVEEHGRGLVERIEPLDSYTGKQIPSGHRGLSFRIEYRDREKTLTTEDVEKIHAAIRESLTTKLNVKLR